MPALRCRIATSAANLGQHQATSPLTTLDGTAHYTRSRSLLFVQRQVKDLKMENSSLRSKLAASEQHGQRISETANVEKTNLEYRITLADHQIRTVIDAALSTQRALIQEIRALLHFNLRLDSHDVLGGRSKITRTELDSQLDWHRICRGVHIPHSGTRRMKLERWAKAVQDYRTEVEERLEAISLLDDQELLDEGSAMDIDEDVAK